MYEGTVMPKLKIDPEFQSKIPPLTDIEFEQLKENILEAGEVFEPIVVWNETIVDGHNRYKVVQEHPEVKWRTRKMDFADKWEAIDWMCKNQLGRRNLTDVQMTILRGKMYEARKHTRGGDRRSEKFSKDQNDPLKNSESRIVTTAESIAKELGVSEPTIKRSEQFAKGFDAIQKEDPALASEILSGKKNVNKGDVINIAKAADEQKPEMIQAIKEDKPFKIGKGFGRPAAYRKQMDEIQALVTDLYDENKEYTFENMLMEIRVNSQNFINMIQNIIKDRKSLITAETVHIVKDELYSGIVQKIMEIERTIKV